MLILSRKIGESILIGDDIEVIVVRTHGDNVRLGISAPQSVAVHRKEVVQRIDAELEAERRKRIELLSREPLED